MLRLSVAAASTDSPIYQFEFKIFYTFWKKNSIAVFYKYYGPF